MNPPRHEKSAGKPAPKRRHGQTVSAAGAALLEAPPVALSDPYLAPHIDSIRARILRAVETERMLTAGKTTLEDFASGHEFFGLHFAGNEWIFREWAPNATAIFIIGSFNGWREDPCWALRRAGADGTWEIRLPADALKHGDLYKLFVHWPGGGGERIPAYARRVVQDERTKIFSAQVWNPPERYAWRRPDFRRGPEAPFIYETHVGMAQEQEKVGSFDEFRLDVLPRIVEAGYNTIQIMAVQEHPYYGSFGYHVTSFFALSSRFGTPEQFKTLVDAAHEAGLAVIMDLVHSHAARNEVEGISRFDGTDYQYFHAGPRGTHELWDSRCFDYGKPQTLHFLLSNCRFWLDEYKVDGFRFDGVTSMLYYHHGMGRAFTNYNDYFGADVDEDALAYLALANKVIHAVRPDAMTVAEDVSGMPCLAAPTEHGGTGFDFRLAMGTPDYWVKLAKHKRDEDWNVGEMWRELTNKRAEEKTIGYVESHDQALVGDQTLIFRLVERDMYDHMSVRNRNLAVDRGLALHKMIRLLTLATAGNGYLNFMGNEFGHPEWIDFPRPGNNWSYRYARRQWRLRDDPELLYRPLGEFDRAMLELARLVKLLDKQDLLPLLEHCDLGLLGFSRAGLVFLFNFNPTRSFPDFSLPAPPGRYRLVLDTDAPCFAGHGRLEANQEYASWPDPANPLTQARISVYLPCRAAIALHKLSR